jgi:uncharacterized integral membrane protein
MLFILILGFILGAAVIAFVLQNTMSVSLVFLSWHFTTSVAILVILALLVGVVLTALMTLPGAIGSSFAMRRLRKHNEALAREAELHKQQAERAATRLAASSGPDVLDLSA